MPNNQYDEAFKKILDNKEIVDELEKASPGIKAKMAGHLMSHWLPSGMARKLVMIIIALAAVTGGIFIVTFSSFCFYCYPFSRPD
ncbi:MAG: hypothetical protein HY092_04315 [Candidatus Kerfeldbacteria bacterium]|nr:hypothetical protein [Candidatus Kerfeldbacteria bacterium]